MQTEDSSLLDCELPFGVFASVETDWLKIFILPETCGNDWNKDKREDQQITQRKPVFCIKLVAGAGFEPTTFRL